MSFFSYNYRGTLLIIIGFFTNRWKTYDKQKPSSSREGLHSSYGLYFFRPASSSFFRACTCLSKNNATVPTFLTSLSFPEVTRVLKCFRVTPSSSPASAAVKTSSWINLIFSLSFMSAFSPHHNESF